MRWRRANWQGWAACLGLFALALNALVPVHVAFDLAAAFGAAPRHSAHEWPVLARLAGHGTAHGKPGEHGKGQATACPVCSALSALAGFVPAAPIALALPPAVATAPALAARGGAVAGAAVVYRSRAPPAA